MVAVPYLLDEKHPRCPACRAKLSRDYNLDWICNYEPKHCGAMFPNMTPMLELFKHLDPEQEQA